MTEDLLLIVKTALHRYAVRRADLLDVRMIADPAMIERGMFDRPCLGVELGTLLDPADQPSLARRHALIVPLRRKYIALLVDYVDTFLERIQCAPLPALLQQRLRQPWAIGALALGDDVIVELDLRAVARSALLSRSDLG